MLGFSKGKNKTPKILIVEDQEYNQDLYRRAFEEDGFEVIFCTSINDFFIEETSRLAPDIIAMDLMIEDDVTENPFAGFELLFLLKQDSRTALIPVIVLTSFFEEGKVLKAKELGAVDFINTSGVGIKQIPKVFLDYLANPKKYQPMHLLFR